MERDTIERMLSRAEGVEVKGDTFEIAEGHGLTFYLGGPGDAMAVREIRSGAFDSDFLVLVTEEGERVYSTYATITALAQKAPRNAPSRRAGFA